MHLAGVRRMAAAMLVATALIGAGSQPAGAEPRAQISPTTELVDQQKVRIAVSGFTFAPEAENRIAIVQCAAEALDVNGCGDFTSINRTFDTTGSVTTRYRVSRILQTPAFGSVDCAAAPQRCVIAVARLDLAEIVVVPISFDPTVPPLPPVDIEATLDPAATVNPRTGVVTLSGSVLCSFPTAIRIVGDVGQEQGETQLFGFVDTIVHCSDTQRWSVRIRSETPGTAFTDGLGFVDLTFVVDRSGPRDRVEISTFALPIVAHPPH